MRICYLADGRAPTPKVWLRHFRQAGHEVHLISTYPCDPADPPVDSLHVVPLDFSARARSVDIGGSKSSLTTHGNPLISRLRGSSLWNSLVGLRNQLMPQAIALQQHKVRRIVDKIQPDLVHAMRVPFEGILAARALQESKYPLLVSSWGNDFTLYAAQSPVVAGMTRQTMLRASALHPDCQRDLRLAREYGFSETKPSLVIPGYGGVPTDVFFPAPPSQSERDKLKIPASAPVVINPRGVKPYIQVDAFLGAIPLVLAKRPDTLFLGGMMKGNAAVEAKIEELGIRQAIRLLSFVPHSEMASLFRLATITVSPSDHDGTPNSLLEGMACGAFPIAGNIESVGEWITDGVNGLLCDQTSSRSIAEAILRAIESDSLREHAFAYNQTMIHERADFYTQMKHAEGFYQQLITR